MIPVLFPNASEEERRQYLIDNCDKVESLSYMKPFTEEELLDLKDNLSTVSIEINEIETEQKEQNALFAAQLKPMKARRGTILTQIRQKAELVTEDVYVFVDYEAGQVGHYNSQGVLIQSRALRPGERQKTIFKSISRTGTDD